MDRKPIIFLGCGDLARRASAALPGRRQIGVARRPQSSTADLELWQGDARDPLLLAKLAALEPACAVITFTPPSPDDAGYRAGYVEALAAVLAGLQPCPPPLLLFVSSTSVYGQAEGQWVDEDSPTEPDSYSGQRLLDAESLLQDYSGCAVALRLAGIYGPGRDYLIRSVRAGQGGSAAHTNRVHAEDAGRAIAHLIGRFEAGANLAPRYLVCDSAPAPAREVRAFIAERLGLDPARLSPSAPERGGDKRCSNARLLATGFGLRYPDYQTGYGELVSG